MFSTFSGEGVADGDSLLSETKLKSEVNTSKTEEQSAVLDVVGGLMELGVGSVWAVGVKEQSAVLDMVGGLTELGAGSSVWAVRVEEQSAVLDVVGGSTTKQVLSKASTQMIVPLGFTSVDKI